ncbi:hypothetical protein GGI22_004777 [Coemansia erecta]|nr:hypothetical protein GGI22_004777 [Coemansia erecta]
MSSASRERYRPRSPHRRSYESSGRDSHRRSDRRDNRDEYGRSRRYDDERAASPRRRLRRSPTRRPDSRPRSPSKREYSERQRPSRFGPPHRARGGEQDPEYYAKRRVQRESIRFSIWESSPSGSSDEIDRADEARVLAEQRRKLDELASRGNDALSADESSDSQSENARSDESDSDSDSQSRRRRRRRSSKQKHSSRKSRHESGSRKRSTHGERKRDRRSGEASDKRRHRRKRRSRTVSARSASPSDHSDDYASGYSGGEVGPMPANDHIPRLPEGSFGNALLPGEGAAMAAYVQAGERIPRRGEIGVDQRMIERLETSGYVMSGNRHRRMDAVRQRKEGQVASAEEKRQMLLQNQEERLKKETQVIAEFKDMLSKKEKTKR